jgi:hypothetical protein
MLDETQELSSEMEAVAVAERDTPEAIGQEIYDSLTDKDKERYSRVTDYFFDHGFGRIPDAALRSMRRSPNRMDRLIDAFRRRLSRKRSLRPGAFGQQGTNRKAILVRRAEALVAEREAKKEERAQIALDVAKKQREDALKLTDSIMEGSE